VERHCGAVEDFAVMIIVKKAVPRCYTAAGLS
jgi:hypothetical protein